MKQMLYFILASFVFAACQKEEIPFYSGGNYLQFVKSYADSTEVSFKYYPEQTVIEYPVALNLVGDPFPTDRKFKLLMVKDQCSVTAEQFDFQDDYILRGDKRRDTVYLKFNKTAELDNRKLRLVLDIVGSETIFPGEHTNTRMVLWLSNSISKPDWWTQNVGDSFLGDYSDLKYEEFLKIPGVSDSTAQSSGSEIYALARKFKRHLEEMTLIGKPVLDENGRNLLYSITVLG